MKLSYKLQLLRETKNYLVYAATPENENITNHYIPKSNGSAPKELTVTYEG